MPGSAPRFSGLPGPAREDQRGDWLAQDDARITELEHARGTVVSNLTQRGVDVDRLLRVREQVESTLQVCRRARVALRSGGAPITPEMVKGTDLDALCSKLATWELG